MNCWADSTELVIHNYKNIKQLKSKLTVNPLSSLAYLSGIEQLFYINFQGSA
jgi:hypothetical protein